MDCNDSMTCSTAHERQYFTVPRLLRKGIKITASIGVKEITEKAVVVFNVLTMEERRSRRPIAIAVDEWNVWYHTYPRYGGIPSENKLVMLHSL